VRRVLRLRARGAIAGFFASVPDPIMFKPQLPISRRTAVVNRAVRFMMPVLAGLSATSSGCAEIGRFTAEDAERAASIAAAVDAAWWPVIHATTNAVSASGDPLGVLADLLRIAPTRLLVP
jgi:hypothetical protein